MKREGEKTDLLELLAQASGCEWISDLHTEAGRHKLAAHLNFELAQGHTSHQWREAYFYITGEEAPGQTPQEVFCALQLFLQPYGTAAPRK